MKEAADRERERERERERGLGPQWWGQSTAHTLLQHHPLWLLEPWSRTHTWSVTFYYGRKQDVVKSQGASKWVIRELKMFETHDVRQGNIRHERLGVKAHQNFRRLHRFHLNMTVSYIPPTPIYQDGKTCSNLLGHNLDHKTHAVRYSRYPKPAVYHHNAWYLCVLFAENTK